MVPIYLLTFLRAFEWLGWQELGQATGAHSIAWIRSYDGWSSNLAAQRLLWFNPQCHHVPHAMYSTHYYHKVHLNPCFSASTELILELIPHRSCGVPTIFKAHIGELYLVIEERIPPLEWISMNGLVEVREKIFLFRFSQLM